MPLSLMRQKSCMISFKADHLNLGSIDSMQDAGLRPFQFHHFQDFLIFPADLPWMFGGTRRRTNGQPSRVAHLVDNRVSLRCRVSKPRLLEALVALVPRAGRISCRMGMDAMNIHALQFAGAIPLLGTNKLT